VKLSEALPDRNLRYFRERYPETDAVQLVHNLTYDREINGIRVMRAGEWLSELSA